MKVELVSRTQGVGRYEGMSAGQIIEAVARHGQIKDYGKLIEYLIKNAHWSPLEHVHYTFRVVTSRAISAQIFRHKSMHFQEKSQRYDEITEFEPIQLRKRAETNRQSSEEVFDPPMSPYIDPWTGENDGDAYPASVLIKEYLNDIQQFYKRLLDEGVARECARMILPMTSQTVIHITGNVRDLLAFLNVRCDAHAQKEVRDIAIAIGEELEKEMPEVMTRINWRRGLWM